jgi:hypothetical protein
MGGKELLNLIGKTIFSEGKEGLLLAGSGGVVLSHYLKTKAICNLW